MRTIVWCAALASCAMASGATVRIVGAEGSWRLERNGKPYFIRGAGGVADYAKFAAMGGNSVRTWGSDKAAETLAAAHWRLRRTGGFYDIYRPGMIVIFR